jgi:hypothetical protein
MAKLMKYLVCALVLLIALTTTEAANHSATDNKTTTAAPKGNGTTTVTTTAADGEVSGAAGLPCLSAALAMTLGMIAVKRQ